MKFRDIKHIKSIYYVYRFFQKQKKYNASFIPKFLNPLYAKHQRNLLEETEKKIYGNYALFIPLLNEVTTLLQRGSGLTDSEMKKSVLSGILTPVFDDLLDLNQINIENQKAVFLEPEKYVPEKLEDDIVKESLQQLEGLGITDSAWYQKSKSDVYQSQILSALQTKSEVTELELKNILLYKTESALTFYYLLLDLKPNNEVLRSIKMFAGLGQMTNDCFDVYKDYVEGIKTFANTCEDFEKLESDFLRDAQEFCAYTRSLGFNKNHTNIYLNSLSIVLAMGLVMIWQLKKIQEIHGKGKLPFNQLPRKAFICDMDLLSNRIRVLKAMEEILC